MKTLALMIALILLLLLASCQATSQKGQELALDIRTKLLESTTVKLTTNVEADYGDRVYAFTFKYTGDANIGVIEITKPDEIAGLTAEVSVSGGTLKYDGAALDTGGVTKDGLSPAEVIPVLISQWQTGYISVCNYEKLGDRDTLAVTTDITETVNEKTWFDTGTLLPLRAELSDSGKMVLACDFENVVIE